MRIFEWDAQKARLNRTKHSVTFEEAQTAFLDDLARIDSDPDHSDDEDREILIGYSTSRRLLVVSFVDRGETLRIISARKADSQERRAHEEKNRR